MGSRNSYLKRTYGIGQAEYDELLAAQGGKCLLCGKQQRYENLAVDHDHVTGEVRGLLCKRCNEGLGRFEYDSQVLRNLVTYVNAMLMARAIYAHNVHSSISPSEDA